MNTNETVVDIAAEIGEKSDFCHNNISTKTWEDWERMHEWLLNLRSRINGFALRRAIELSKQFVPGNAAAMREALAEIVADLEPVRKWTMPPKNDNELTALFAAADTVYSKAKAALTAPPRNCDRFKTADEASEAWLELDESDDGALEPFDWIFATAEGGHK